MCVCVCVCTYMLVPFLLYIIYPPLVTITHVPPNTPKNTTVQEEDTMLTSPPHHWIV